MGTLSATLPTEAAWETTGPAWARDSWPILPRELDTWCVENNADLDVVDNATVYSDDE